MVQDIIEGQEKRVRIMWQFRDSLRINIEKLNGDLEPMMEKMMLKDLKLPQMITE